jgi:general secretion pathway protein J
MPRRSTRRCATPHCAGGFTLVELMVALVVLATLAVLSWQGLDGMVRAQSRTQAYSNDLAALHNTLAQWGADLDAMDNQVRSAADAQARPRPIDWNGQALRITRNNTPTGAQGSGMLVVAWSVRGVGAAAQLLRWQSPVLHSRAEWAQAWQQAAAWARNPDDASRRNEVATVPVTGWQVFYFRGDAWSNPASSAETASTLPDGVRLVLTLAPGQVMGGSLTRDWVRPTVSGNKS